ncbi:putative ankyrin repeat protein RF_0381 [Artemia franciscana]|uniref:putative ankyrin repeat protein RF_0381 n=1 Tax=Artemia franciscana TaxID=6661 RepID=UPI0032DA6C69
MVKYLLESGADPNCAQCLHHAVSKGKQNLCQLLISYGANVDEINMNCETPLVTAILANNSDMVKYLLESGANPNFAQCLHHAAQKGRADICRLLFSYGADLNTMNANNETPLMLAIKSASHLPLDGPDRWLHRLNRQMATVKYLIYQQIHCNVNVSSESLLLVLSMVNRWSKRSPFCTMPNIERCMSTGDNQAK